MLLKKILFPLLFFTFILKCFGQDNEDSFYLAKMEEVKISLKKNFRQSRGQIPVSSVTVLDARYDTSCLGFVDGSKKIITSNYLANDIESYISQNYLLATKESNRYRLVILLEKLWLTSSFEIGVTQKQDFAVLHKDLFGVKHEPKAGDVATISNAALVKAKILIAIGDEYHPFYQLDNYYILPQNTHWQASDTIVSNVVDSILYKVVNHNIDSLHYKKSISSLGDIQTYIASKFTIPILNTNSYSKGVFLNFEEFKNNTPSVKDFNIERNSKEDILTVKDENGTTHPLRNFFGCSDGQNIFIYKADRLFRLYKKGNTLIFLGTNSGVLVYHKNWKNVVAGLAISDWSGASILTAPRFRKNMTPFQLDLDTGDCW